MDEDEREEWLAYFAEVCPNCGNLRSECSDPSRDWYPQESVCWASAQVAAGTRDLREHYKDEEFRTGHLHSLDGVSVFATPVDLGNWSLDEKPEPSPDA